MTWRIYLAAGGCNHLPKPSDYKWCASGCPVAHSYCSGHEYCACADGYNAMYSDSGALLSCHKPASPQANRSITVQINDTHKIDPGTPNLMRMTPIKLGRTMHRHGKGKDGIVHIAATR